MPFNVVRHVVSIETLLLTIPTSRLYQPHWLERLLRLMRLCERERTNRDSLPKKIIHSGYFYSASSRPLLIRGFSDTSRILCRSFTPKSHRQLRVKDLPKAPTWRLERDLNPRPFRRKATNLSMSNHAPIRWFI